MSKYLDDRTRASDPGKVSLSLARLPEVEPELLHEGRTFKCSPLCPVDHPASEMRERIVESLADGDSRAALVVSVAPLVVAAYSSDLDAVALLRFPQELVHAHSLTVGTRLLTVNTYRDVRSPNGTMLYAVDLVPGQLRTGWSNFAPLIADFLTDDRARVEARKRDIAEEEWALAADRAETRVVRLGLSSARSGKPTRVGFPVRSEGIAPYGPLDRDGTVSLKTMSASNHDAPANRTPVYVAIFLVAVVLFILLRR